MHHVAQSHGGHPGKWLGDGVRFRFPEPVETVLGALAVGPVALEV